MRPEPPIAALPDRVLDLVQEVDREHDFTPVSGAEGFFTDRLRDAISRGGELAQREVRYTGTGKSCDLLAELDGRRCYLEVKLLFSTYWASRWPERPRERLLAPLGPFAHSSDKYSAAGDLRKLATNPLPRPDLLGILVVSSHDAAFDPGPDFGTLTTLARLDGPPWLRAARRFPNTFWHASGGYQLDARVWLCPAEEMPAWWATVRDLYPRRPV